MKNAETSRNQESAEHNQNAENAQLEHVVAKNQQFASNAENTKSRVVLNENIRKDVAHTTQGHVETDVKQRALAEQALVTEELKLEAEAVQIRQQTERMRAQFANTTEGNQAQLTAEMTKLDADEAQVTADTVSAVNELSPLWDGDETSDVLASSAEAQPATPELVLPSEGAIEVNGEGA